MLADRGPWTWRCVHARLRLSGKFQLGKCQACGFFHIAVKGRGVMERALQCSFCFHHKHFFNKLDGYIEQLGSKGRRLSFRGKMVYLLAGIQHIWHMAMESPM